jgi:hypothetical protein
MLHSRVGSWRRMVRAPEPSQTQGRCRSCGGC